MIRKMILAGAVCLAAAFASDTTADAGDCYGRGGYARGYSSGYRGYSSYRAPVRVTPYGYGAYRPPIYGSGLGYGYGSVYRGFSSARPFYGVPSRYGYGYGRVGSPYRNGISIGIGF